MFHYHCNFIALFAFSLNIASLLLTTHSAPLPNPTIATCVGSSVGASIFLPTTNCTTRRMIDFFVDYTHVTTFWGYPETLKNIPQLTPWCIGDVDNDTTLLPYRICNRRRFHHIQTIYLPVDESVHVPTGWKIIPLQLCFINAYNLFRGTIGSRCNVSPSTHGGRSWVYFWKQPFIIVRIPTQRPSDGPTISPTVTPTRKPTSKPSLTPVHVPSAIPSTKPSANPTNRPTLVPSFSTTTESTRTLTRRPLESISNPTPESRRPTNVTSPHVSTVFAMRTNVSAWTYDDQRSLCDWLSIRVYGRFKKEKAIVEERCSWNKRLIWIRRMSSDWESASITLIATTNTNETRDEINHDLNQTLAALALDVLHFIQTNLSKNVSRVDVNGIGSTTSTTAAPFLGVDSHVTLGVSATVAIVIFGSVSCAVAFCIMCICIFYCCEFSNPQDKHPPLRLSAHSNTQSATASRSPASSSVTAPTTETRTQMEVQIEQIDTFELQQVQEPSLSASESPRNERVISIRTMDGLVVNLPGLMNIQKNFDGMNSVPLDMELNEAGSVVITSERK